ncbi:2-hydroxyacid dehydrogenase [Thermomonospora cellulosilytica]|uniref:Phosphoglycerate dehydrogenase-like enzyme n=1 Tax=Thermomonospora cellulosilytica TaxID=1411118 RepID=A0A7W3N4E6_9ACTN|nr:2-hydroxyacid dehydrogenase [Thermomonospora cellulosilytica]MBA9007325.1 phosphoglycerate dehydrogenase-like enzyme [Thermomonospora cellulosilytica]
MTTTLWVARPEIAEAVRDLPGVTVEVWADGPAPGSIEDVEFYVPVLMPSPAGLEVMARMPRLRVVQLQTAGFEHVEPHLPEGVTLCNARGAHDAGTAEWAVGAIIAALREFPEFAAAQREGRWAYRQTAALADSRVLLVGYGSIGQAVERRLAPFEVQITRVASRAREGVHGVDELPELIGHADVVVLLVPANEQTRGMIDAEVLARMKDGALLVNAARGGVVDTGALVAETSRGRLRAALDVTDPEPLPPDHPLWRCPGVFITPHVAGSTPASVRRIAWLVREQAARYLAGEPLRNTVAGPSVPASRVGHGR